MEPSSIVDRQDVRARVHGMWAAVAPGWAEHAGSVDARTAGLAERLLDLASIAPGDRVLELACGPGGLGIAAARRVDGIEVVLSDVAAPMVAIAAPAPTGSRTCVRASWTSRRSTSRTGRSTCSCAGRGSCSPPTRSAPAASCTASRGPARASRSPSGGRGSAIPGWASSSTR